MDVSKHKMRIEALDRELDGEGITGVSRKGYGAFEIAVVIVGIAKKPPITPPVGIFGDIAFETSLAGSSAGVWMAEAMADYDVGQ